MKIASHTLSPGEESFVQTSSRRGFTLVELMVTVVLLVLLATGVLGSITTMHKLAKKQATYNSVMALVMSEQEAIRTNSYNPPTAPFTAEESKTVEKKYVSLDPDKDDFSLEVSLVTKIEPISSGHKVTISGTYSYGDTTPTITTTTLVNKYSKVNL